MNIIEGFLLLHKPAGITSFDCVYKIRRLVGRRLKVGHTGTLDSFASGLLIIAINRTATRHIQKIMELDKRYTAYAKLGQLTETLDYTGKTVAEQTPPMITQQECTTVLEQFGSAYLQTPPIFSALRHQGKRLSTMARAGELSEQELLVIAKQKQRTAFLYQLTLKDFSFPYMRLQAHVSHGTYIRSLAHDIALKLGTWATTYELERTAIGDFTLEQAVTLEELASSEDVAARIITVEQMCARVGLR